MLVQRLRTARVSRLAAGLLTLLASISCLAAAPELPADFARYRGQVVVVDFWASWCKPCRQSIPWLNELRTRYGPQGLVIVGVNVDANRADAEKFQREVPIGFEVLYDPEGKLAEQFGLKACQPPSCSIAMENSRTRCSAIAKRNAVATKPKS
jgi:thiol-disulfide isomerase/thioredoxin